MNCNCLTELKERLMNDLPKQKRYEKMVINRVRSDNEMFLFGGQGDIRSSIAIPFTIEHEPLSRKKETTVNMTVSYCPFCGKNAHELPQAFDTTESA